MNQVLTNEIVNHIMFNLSFNKLKQDKFITPYTIEFESNNESNFIYMAQGAYQTVKFYAIYSELKSYNENILLIQLQDCPIYGLYFKEKNKADGFIACQPVSNDSWLPASIYIQSTFLAGMEQVMESQIIFEKIIDGKQFFEKIKSFILYHDSLFEEN